MEWRGKMNEQNKLQQVYTYLGSGQSDTNPYQGDIVRGIKYDTKEINTQHIEQIGNWPMALTSYRRDSTYLMRYVNVENGLLLEVGSGTGIATLEATVRMPKVDVLGVEISSGMMKVAEYKFHQNGGKGIVDHPESTDSVRAYWDEFRRESNPHKDRVKFLQGDIRTLELPSENFDGAIANQAMHWMSKGEEWTELGILRAFEQVNSALKHGSNFVWSSASHFYNTPEFPASKFGFRYNQIMEPILEAFTSRGIALLGDYKNVDTPVYELEDIVEMTAKAGLETKQVMTYLERFDLLQNLLFDEIPGIVRGLVQKEVSDAEVNKIFNEAVSKIVLSRQFLEDQNHRYDIIPVFVSKKK